MTSTLIRGGRDMSRPQEPWSEVDRFDQLNPRDSGPDLSGLISRLNNGSLDNGNNDRGYGIQDNGVTPGRAVKDDNGVLGNSGSAGNSGVTGFGDTVPYMRPPRPAAVEPQDAHDAANVGPEPSGANGHGATAARAAYAARSTHATPRHSRGSAETTERAARPAQPEIAADPEITAPAEITDGADVTTGLARPERPAPGSLADLRQRLERLPYGHPSSPYHVDGERKAPPHRLKHLELAPSAPSRLTQGHSQPPVVDDDPIAYTPARPATPAITSEPPTPSTTQGVAPEPPGSPAPAMLTQDQMRIADDAYDRFRAAEGRNIFGSYGTTGLTVVLRDLATSLEYGELAEDTEQNSLLEPDAFKARFAAMLARYPERSAELLARRIPGAISYSFIFDAERYSAGIWMVQDALAGTGFQLLARRNDWNSAANKCVATMWHDPTNGLPFEVQFHTTASLEAQRLARSSASLISDPRIPSAEAANLRSDLAAAWAALPTPPGHAQIGDYRRDGGSPPPGSDPSPARTQAARSSADPRHGERPPGRSTP